jgi:hypothetical protein
MCESILKESVELLEKLTLAYDDFIEENISNILTSKLYSEMASYSEIRKAVKELHILTVYNEIQYILLDARKKKVEKLIKDTKHRKQTEVKHTPEDGMTVTAFSYNTLMINPALFGGNEFDTETELRSDLFIQTFMQYKLYTYITSEKLLNDLKNKFYKLQSNRLEACGIVFGYMQNPVYSAEILNLEKRIVELDNTGFDQPLPIDEKVNGWLVETPATPIMTKKLFDEFKVIFDNYKAISYEDFYARFNSDACSDWSKQEPDGECYGGFWKYPEGSEERKNAWQLTRELNCKELYKLPYPPEAIFLTIKLGCNNRRESVVYTNTMCEWVKRKLSQLNLV